MKMSPAVWAITGFKRETFVGATCSKNKVLPDKITGRFNGTGQTIMEGGTWVGEVKTLGYAFVKVSLQNIEEFEDTPVALRGLGAVSGGFISSSDKTSSEPFKTEQKWGVIDTSKAIYLCGFYGKDRYNRVMVCFDRTNVAPVSSFWRNGKVLIGPNIRCDKADWGRNFNLGSFAVALEKVKSAVVLNVEFPELSRDGATTAVGLEVMFTQVFTNGSSATVKDNFNMKTTLLDTHTFAFEEGLGVDWSAGWKTKVPLLSEARTTVDIEVSFVPHQLSATSKTQAIDRSAEITLTPMTSVKATARYVKTVLAVDAVLTVHKTYTNGASHTRQVPAKYTGVSCDLAEIRLEGIPVAPTSIQ